MAKLNLNRILKDTGAKLLRTYSYGSSEKIYYVQTRDGLIVPVNDEWDHDFLLDLADGLYRDDRELVNFFELLQDLTEKHPLFAKGNHFVDVTMLERNFVVITFGAHGDGVVPYGRARTSISEDKFFITLRNISIDYFANKF